MIGKFGKECSQLVKVNDDSVNRHLQGVLEIHEEIFNDSMEVNRSAKRTSSGCRRLHMSFFEI